MPNPARAWRDLPRLVRFLLSHGAIGFGLSALLVGGLVMADPNDAGRLLLNGAGHWWPAAVLWFFCGLTFGAVQIAVATMLLAEEWERPARPTRGGGAPVLVPIRVRAGRRR
jgi:hypothetical protein